MEINFNEYVAKKYGEGAKIRTVFKEINTEEWGKKRLRHYDLPVPPIDADYSVIDVEGDKYLVDKEGYVYLPDTYTIDDYSSGWAQKMMEGKSNHVYYDWLYDAESIAYSYCKWHMDKGKTAPLTSEDKEKLEKFAKDYYLEPDFQWDVLYFLVNDYIAWNRAS